MFYKIRKTSQPSKAFKKTLLVECKNEFMPTTQKTFRFAVSGTIALLIVFGVSTGVFAYENPGVVEGHPLNFVKENLEKFQGKMARSPEGQAKFHAKMMNRRFEEAEKFKGNDARKEVFLEKASAELDLSLEDLKEKLDNEDTREEIMAQLKESSVKHAPLFDKKGKDFKGKGIGPDVSEFRAELKKLNLEPEEMHEAMKEHMDELLNARLEKIKIEDPANYDSAVLRAEKQKEIHEEMHENMMKRVDHWKEKTRDRKDEEQEDPEELES